MKLKRLATTSAVAAVAIVVAGTVLAQGPGRMMGERGCGMWDSDSRGWGMGWGMWRGRQAPWGHGPDWMLERVEGRLAFLKSELKIGESQTVAWNELAQAVRTAAKHRTERMKTIIAADEKARTLPERLELQEQFMAVRLDELKQIKSSLKNLYAILSEEQKKEADEMVIPMVGMGPGWAT